MPIPVPTRSVPFGRQLLHYWALDPDTRYLNHGTVGATPNAVLAAQRALRDEIERQPARFLLRELTPIGREADQPNRALAGGPQRRLRRAADSVASRLGLHGDQLVFVANATEGANAVLSSFPLKHGDEVLVSNFTYGAVTRAAQHCAARAGATVRTLHFSFPATSNDEICETLASELSGSTRLALLDHVTPETALIMPVARIAAICRAAGIATMVDGAHAPGAIPVDIASLGVDYYTANLHKWAFSPRSAGVLWAAPSRRDGLHPPVISWGHGGGWIAEFDWTGTRDPTAYLCAPHGFDFIDEALGGTEALWAYTHALAREAAQALCARWRLPFSTPPDMIGSMVCIPLPRAAGVTSNDATTLKNWLLVVAKMEAQIYSINDQLYWRFSAQAYNDITDVAAFADAIENFIAMR